MFSQLAAFPFLGLWQPLVLVESLLVQATYWMVVRGPWGPRYFTQFRPVSNGPVACFMGAAWLYFLAFGSPLSVIASHFLFSARMLQDMVDVLVVVPLLLLGLPDWLVRPAWDWRPIRTLLRGLTHPLVALLLFNVVFSVAHVPAVYDATLHQGLFRDVRPLLYGITAFVMWWPILTPLVECRLHPGIQLLYLFVDGLLLTPIFLFMTLTNQVLYPAYVHTTETFGLSPLADQKLGGIIMKAGALVVYAAAFIGAFLGWMRREVRGSGYGMPISAIRPEPRPPIDFEQVKKRKQSSES